MGEAFLHGHGSGLRFRSLSASLPAPHNVFYNGQAIDISHAVIYANLGRSTVKIAPDGCTVSPAIATTGLQSVTVSCKLGGTTRTASIPVTVIATSDTFANNSWAVIAQAAYYGFPKLIWNLGDEKTVSIGSTTHTLRIIGFDNDQLNENDAKYSDPFYNRGTKKTALTLQWKTPAGSGKMHPTASSNIYWKNCNMRTVTLPALCDSLPADIKNNIRTVDKWNFLSAVYQQTSVVCTNPEKLPETIFLLNNFDANYTNRNVADYDEFRVDQVYGFFDYQWQDVTKDVERGYKFGDYQSYDLAAGEWSRACYYPRTEALMLRFISQTASSSYNDKYGYVRGDSTKPYFPVFNF